MVFIHGLWLLPSSWDNWAEMFEEAGYVALTPDWPDDPETVEGARAEPEIFANKTKQVADHTTPGTAGLSQVASGTHLVGDALELAGGGTTTAAWIGDADGWAALGRHPSWHPSCDAFGVSITAEGRTHGPSS